jgi:hypothetical protein
MSPFHAKSPTSENWGKKISVLVGFFRHRVKNHVKDILHPLQETI